MIDLSKVTKYSKPRELSKEEFLRYIELGEEIYGFKGWIEVNSGFLDETISESEGFDEDKTQDSETQTTIETVIDEVTGLETTIPIETDVLIFDDLGNPIYRQKTWREYVNEVVITSLDGTKAIMPLGWRSNKCRYNHLSSKELYDYVGVFGAESILTKDEVKELVNSDAYKNLG